MLRRMEEILAPVLTKSDLGQGWYRETDIILYIIVLLSLYSHVNEEWPLNNHFVRLYRHRKVVPKKAILVEHAFLVCYTINKASKKYLKACARKCCVGV